MSWGYAAYAAIMAALVVVYLRGVRSYGLDTKRIAVIALIWIGIIGGGYLLVSGVLGVS
ncbi:hypothetical protein [Erythrobacter litoralis]|uniref:hypothetical protein n=1 Tax=Erythrobacter litoralis TaxID=39960 RepID=UPI002436044F|nr:hypothetical protein [Erythrobacter litoralis]